MRLPSYSRWSTKIATWSSTPESICLLETARFTRVQYANGKLCTSRVQKITSCCNGNRTRSLSYCCCSRFVVFCWISGNEEVQPIVEEMSCLHCVRTDVNPELCCEFPKWMSQCQSPWQATGNPQLVGIFRARCNSLLFYSPVQLNLSRAETEKVRTGHNEWLKTKVSASSGDLHGNPQLFGISNEIQPEFLTLIGVQLNPNKSLQAGHEEGLKLAERHFSAADVKGLWAWQDLLKTGCAEGRIPPVATPAVQLPVALWKRLERQTQVLHLLWTTKVTKKQIPQGTECSDGLSESVRGLLSHREACLNRRE